MFSVIDDIIILHSVSWSEPTSQLKQMLLRIANAKLNLICESVLPMQKLILISGSPCRVECDVLFSHELRQKAKVLLNFHRQKIWHEYSRFRTTAGICPITHKLPLFWLGCWWKRVNHSVGHLRLKRSLLIFNWQEGLYMLPLNYFSKVLQLLEHFYNAWHYKPWRQF